MCHKLFMVCSILGCVLFIPGGALFIPRGCLIHPHPALIIPRVGLNWSPGMNRSLYLIVFLLCLRTLVAHSCWDQTVLISLLGAHLLVLLLVSPHCRLRVFSEFCTKNPVQLFNTASPTSATQTAIPVTLRMEEVLVIQYTPTGSESSTYTLLLIHSSQS